MPTPCRHSLLEPLVARDHWQKSPLCLSAPLPPRRFLVLQYRSQSPWVSHLLLPHLRQAHTCLHTLVFPFLLASYLLTGLILPYEGSSRLLVKCYKRALQTADPHGVAERVCLALPFGHWLWTRFLSISKYSLPTSGNSTISQSKHLNGAL